MIRLTVVLFGVMLSSLVAARASGQEDACGKVLLLPLHDPRVQIADNDRAFLNLHYFCALAPHVEEQDIRESGIDLGSLYGAAMPKETPSFSKLRTWAATHCGSYGEGDQLARTIASIITRSDKKVAEEYEACGKSAGLTCYAIPSGRDSVGLFVKWSSQQQPSGKDGEPEIEEAKATGAILPSEMLDRGLITGTSTNPITSLAHAAVPQAGLLRLFLRNDRDSDVLFEVRTSGGSCTTKRVGPVVRRGGVWAVREDGKRWEDFLNTKGETWIERDHLIWIDVADLKAGIDELAVEKKLPKPDAGLNDLVPFIDGVPLLGIHPLNPGDRPEDVLEEGEPVHHLHFKVTRDDENKKSWDHLLYLDGPRFSRRVGITVGFENGATLPTQVTNKDDNNHPASLTVVPTLHTVLGGLLIGSALLLFLVLAGRTDIIRDTSAPYRPDGRSPFSLGRSQMAFWFFLVLAAYFGLWMVTGDKDTVTNSTAELIGISAATALGAAFIDSAAAAKYEKYRRVLPPDAFNDVRGTIAVREKELLDLEKRRTVLVQELSSIQIGDEKAREAMLWALQTMDRDLTVGRQQIEFLRMKPWKRLLYDLVGEDYTISFHKFQIFVWTLVLGTIFVTEVLHRLTMPEFSTTLLAIMGISGGTYVGFKLPEQRRNAPAAQASR